MNVQKTVDRARGLVAETLEEANAALSRNEPGEAKRLLAQCQKELGEMKREVADSEREMRPRYQEMRLKVDRGEEFDGPFGKTLGVSKRVLESIEIGQAYKHRRLNEFIDDFFSQVDNMKFKVDSAQESAVEIHEV